MILWKRGIVQRGEFARFALEQVRRGQRSWSFSFKILREIEERYSPADEPLLENLYLSLRSGTHITKMTRRGRFTEFDEKIVTAARSAFPHLHQELVVHDMGASNAITSLELFQRFAQERNIRVIASDIFHQLKLVTLPNRRWTVAFNTLSQPIQTTGLGMVMGTRPFPWHQALSRFVQMWVRSSVIPAAQHILEQGPCDSIEPVSLFHPEAVAQSRSDSRFQLTHYDIFHSPPVPCDIIRGLNLILPGFFTREQTQTAICRNAEILREGGWMILGRSIEEEDGRIRATVYQRSDGKLIPLFHHHEGFENPELVSELTLPGPASVDPACPPDADDPEGGSGTNRAPQFCNTAPPEHVSSSTEVTHGS